MAEVIFMPAATAYNVSLQNYEAQLRKNRQELNSLIEAATQAGQFKVIYDRQLFDGITQWLQDYGYEVTQKTLSDSKKKILIVSWQHAGIGS